jgi:hypothetical protein
LRTMKTAGGSIRVGKINSIIQSGGSIFIDPPLTRSRRSNANPPASTTCRDLVSGGRGLTAVKQQ